MTKLSLLSKKTSIIGLIMAYIIGGFSSMLLMNPKVKSINIQKPNIQKSLDADDIPVQHCQKYYIDMGSNIGVQIRKLFEPIHYPDAPVLKVFSDYFGTQDASSSSSKICAIGFEMNPVHTNRLKSLESIYNKCGFHTKIYTETAVSTTSKEMTQFWSDHDFYNHEWGASAMYKWPEQKDSAMRLVNSIDISDFMLKHVIPYASTIVVKMDIEGQEVKILPDLLASGAMCHIDLIFIELHDRMISDSDTLKDFHLFMNSLEYTLKNSNCKTKISYVDDETYNRDDQLDISNCLTYTTVNSHA